MAELKTKKTEESVEEFINKQDENRRKDCFTLIEMFQKATKAEAKLWGTAIIGFGDYRYKSERSGREVDWFKIGFSPRKSNLTLYLVNKSEEMLKKLGKHKVEGGCLHIKKLEDIDLAVLQQMLNTTSKKFAG